MFVPAVTQAKCVKLCEENAECEAVVMDASTHITACWGKKDVMTSAAEGGCQVQPPFITVMVPANGSRAKRGPMGKCTILGDPHVTGFDRKMIGSLPVRESRNPEGGSYMKPVDVLRAGEYTAVTTPAGLRVDLRAGYTDQFPSAASATGIAIGGAALGDKVAAMAFVGSRVSEDGEDDGGDGWLVTYGGKEVDFKDRRSFRSPDDLVRIERRKMSPAAIQEVCVRCRSTIGTADRHYWTVTFHLRGGAASGGAEVWVLPGPGLGNVVITMRRVPGQDGLCGNFNCQWEDDGRRALGDRGWRSPLRGTSSLFPQALAPPRGWNVRKGKSPEEVLRSCPKAVKSACDGMQLDAERSSCIFDRCMEHASTAALGQRLFAVRLPGKERVAYRRWPPAGALRVAVLAASALGACAVVAIGVPVVRARGARLQTGAMSRHSCGYVLLPVDADAPAE